MLLILSANKCGRLYLFIFQSFSIKNTENLHQIQDSAPYITIQRIIMRKKKGVVVLHTMIESGNPRWIDSEAPLSYVNVVVLLSLFTFNFIRSSYHSSTFSLLNYVPACHSHISLPLNANYKSSTTPIINDNATNYQIHM